MANRLYDDQDTEDFLDGSDSQTDKTFQDIVDGNYSDDEKQALSEEASEQTGKKSSKKSKSGQSSAEEDDLFNIGDEERKKLEDKGYLVEKVPEHKKDGLVKRYGKKKVAIFASGLALSAGVGIFGWFLSLLPFEMQHVKNVFETEIGGVRDTVLQTRSGRLYSRSFFFHKGDDGTQNVFSGYKERGMVATLTGKNFRSNRLINKMSERGITINPELDAKGRFTGRIGSIQFTEFESRLGRSVDVQIDTGSGFRDAWNSRGAARGAIREALDETFPDKSRFWRARKARSVYSRWRLGFFRTDWLSDGAVRSARNMTMKIRGAILGGDRDFDPRINASVDETLEDDTTTQKDLTDKWENEAAEDQERFADGEDRIRPEVNAKDIDPVTRAAGRAVSLFGGVQTACDMKRILNTVVVASRVLRAQALMTYATMFMSLADISLTGEVDAQDVNAFVNLMRTNNPNTGRDFFGSGSWLWASTGRGTVNGNIRNNYSIGGNLTGTLGDANAKIDSIVGGNSQETCGFVNNIFVQLGAGLVGAIVGFFTGGASVVANAAIQVGLSIVYAIIEAIAIPMIIEMVAGTVIHGQEFGDEMAAAVLSGYVAYLGVQGNNHGFKPVTNTQLAVLVEERDKNIAYEQSKMSLFERYLSPENHRSLTSVASISIPRSLKSVGTTLGELINNPFRLVASPLGVINDSRSMVAAQGGDTSQCQQEDIVENDFATDPFCNLMFAQNVEALAIDPIDNLSYMLRNGFVDEDGVPQDTPNGRRYQEFLRRCVNQLDVLHNNEQEYNSDYTDQCYAGLEDGNLADIACSNQPIAKITPEEFERRQNTVYDFDDLQIAYMIQDGDYQENVAKGKVYAQASGEELATRCPSLLERFEIQRMDDVMLDAMSEELTGDFSSQSPEASPVGTPGGIPSGGLELPPNFDPTPQANGYYVMPEPVDGSYVFSDSAPARSRCGSQKLIEVIYTVAQRWHARYPNSALRVGDLNEEAGHASHNHGVDVDITIQGSPQAADTSLDPSAQYSIELARMFADTEVIDVIGYQDNRVINDYATYAAANGLPGRVSPWSGHADHFHVRILSDYRGQYSANCSN